MLISCQNPGSQMCVGQIELLGETCVFDSDHSYESVSEDLQSMLNDLKVSDSTSRDQDKNRSFSTTEENSGKGSEATQASHRKSYEEAVRRELGPKPGNIDLSTALQLEIERVQLGLTVKDREEVEAGLGQTNTGLLDPLRQISSDFSLDLRRMQVRYLRQLRIGLFFHF